VARKPPAGPPGGDRPEGAGPPPAAEVEAAIQKALDALRPRTPAARTVKPRRPAKGRPRPDNDA
jgi:hypothetical protein